MIEFRILAEQLISTQRSYRYDFELPQGASTASKRFAVAPFLLTKKGSPFELNASMTNAVNRRRDRRLGDFRFHLPMKLQSLGERFSFDGARLHISGFRRLVDSPEAERLFRCIHCRRFGISNVKRSEPQLFCPGPEKCKVRFHGERRKDPDDTRGAAGRYRAAYQAQSTLTEFSKKALKHCLGADYTWDRLLNLEIIFRAVSDAERGDLKWRKWLKEPAGEFADVLGRLDDGRSVKRAVEKLLELTEQAGSKSA